MLRGSEWGAVISTIRSKRVDFATPRPKKSMDRIMAERKDRQQTAMPAHHDGIHGICVW